MLPPDRSSKMRHSSGYTSAKELAEMAIARVNRVLSRENHQQPRGSDEWNRLHDRLRGSAFVSFASPSTSGTRHVESWFETAFITGPAVSSFSLHSVTGVDRIDAKIQRDR